MVGEISLGNLPTWKTSIQSWGIIVMPPKKYEDIRGCMEFVRSWAHWHNTRTSWWSDTLSGACWSCSYYLYKELKALGYNPQMVRVSSGGSICCHVFLLLDNYILDITATQFGITDPYVIIGKKRWPKRKWFWKNWRPWEEGTQKKKYYPWGAYDTPYSITLEKSYLQFCMINNRNQEEMNKVLECQK
jgi:hypothetical protein